LGKNETTALLQKVSGVDVAIIGHDLGILNQPKLFNKTILVQNSTEGKFFGVLDLAIGEKGAIKNYTGSVTGIVLDTPLDPEVHVVMQEFEKQKDLNRAKKGKTILSGA
jgi:2',3'-cyclic-nucleotide 2'-phosphodiesterase (5'-nucleotidase family)